MSLIKCNAVQKWAWRSAHNLLNIKLACDFGILMINRIHFYM